jgi:hypothetical protein
MEKFEDPRKSVGLIFDVSIRHFEKKGRIIDFLKKLMVNVVVNLFVDQEDSFYLYDPEIYEATEFNGNKVALIGNYNTDGRLINLNYAFKQTLYILMGEPINFRKYLIFITDRIEESKFIEKALKTNKSEDINSYFYLIGVGENYNNEVLNKFKNLDNVSVFHIKDLNDLSYKIFLENANG